MRILVVMVILIYAVIFVFALYILSLIYLLLSVSVFKAYWKKRKKIDGELVYIALGDSAAQAIGATHPNAGYVGLIANKLGQATGKSIKIINISVTGAKIRDVIDKQLPMITNISPDILTIEVGANNISAFNNQAFAKEFSELAALLPVGTFISNMPYFGSRPKLTPLALQASTIIEDIVLKNKHLTLVDLQDLTLRKHTFFGYAADLFHPNNIAYKNWAAAFWHKIEPNLNNISKN